MRYRRIAASSILHLQDGFGLRMAAKCADARCCAMGARRVHFLIWVSYMPTTKHLLGLLVVFVSPMVALAQDASKDAAPASCEARAGAPQWLPCGPDRVFSEAEVKSQLIKEDAITKMVVTSGKSGKRFFVHFKPGGKLDSGPEGGTNFGKSWKFKGNQVCRDYYRITQVDCGVFELQGTTLYLVDDDGARSPVNAFEFAKP